MSDSRGRFLLVSTEKGDDMNLHTVTITGPDDQTNLADLIRLSTEFPFLE